MEKGTIKKKVEDRGFGFISCEGKPKDLFFHSKNVVGTTFEELREGDAVTFDVVDSDQGRQAAENVAKAS
ncbi:MAG: cold shock domain-containing protein [Candidatus Taylorbacteria bacterium]|nr:cold shock domain-containing protein [Candidatus Taylorbacteria bacterium]